MTKLTLGILYAVAAFLAAFGFIVCVVYTAMIPSGMLQHAFAFSTLTVCYVGLALLVWIELHLKWTVLRVF